MDVKTPRLEAEGEIASEPMVRSEVGNGSSTKKTTQFTQLANNNDSESDFPELPPFKKMRVLPSTPQKPPLQSNPIVPAVLQFPPTPDTTPARRHRLKHPASPFKDTFRRTSFPTSRAIRSSILNGIRRKKPAPSVSALEFDRIVEAVLEQVDWKVVSEHVASNRPEGVYKTVVVDLLKEKAGLLKEIDEEMSG